MTASLARRYRAYWLDFAVARGKLVAFRVAFFTVLGIDAFLQIAHAPRYGAGAFNVSHLPWLDPVLPMPGRAGMLVVFALQSYLALRIALGAAGRLPLVLLTALYGYAYFISQLDSYQHHYLVFWLLVLSCFVPWQAGGAARARDAAAQDPLAVPGRVGLPVRSWALRLILAQIAIMYAWAAVSKLEPLWLDGTTLARQLQVPWIRALTADVLATRADPTGFALAAKLVLATELVLAVAWPWRRLWPVALVIGVGFHIAVELTGMQIGVFSYFMFALYILVVPEAWIRVAARAGRRCSGCIGHWLGRPFGAWRAWLKTTFGHRGVMTVLVAILIGGGSALLLLVPLAEMRAVAVITALLTGGALVMRRRDPGAAPGAAHRQTLAYRQTLAHAAACAALLVLSATTGQVHDYYKFWAGSARRLGDAAGAETAYRAITRISPWYGPGHYHLAEIERREGRVDRALRGYRRAQEAAPHDYRPFLAEAEIHDAAGRGAEAAAAAGRVIELAPRRARDLQRARALVQRWTGP